MFFRKQKGVSGGIGLIICGLGNPGTRYENTRHNCGFMVIDDLSKKYGVPVKKLRFKSLTGEAVIDGARCLLMKPTTYMNKSGEAVTEALRFYKIPPENALLICDDINLDVGVIRVREKGSDGGQKGLQNIIYLSGSDAFPRVRIGVGGKPHPDYDLADWVTGPFFKTEKDALEFALGNAVAAAEMFAAGDIVGAMNKFNGLRQFPENAEKGE
ncbi:MAG: aminoacyl-tRNA hydrolase [Oscillospiraceae bacterium]|jgi:PTH1 family peptidyl-tRNA hydrolase|nr:aminoacyl-tRNA hydrolase [Oscillospiraceae bacterium]